MSEMFSIIYLARHGETAWSLSGQHRGLTDLPLTERGERNAHRLKERLRGLSFARVFTSPLQRTNLRTGRIWLWLKSTATYSNGPVMSD
jgi:broad specificity phosphatase PhoE